MHELTKEELEALVKKHSSDYQCLSFYMPTMRAGRETHQNQVRLKNLHRVAHHQLGELGLGEEPVRKLLKPVAALMDDQDFWHHPQDALAMFLAPDYFYTLKLPYEVREVVTVADSFHLKPLLPMLENNSRFYILALSQKSVTLYKADRFRIEEVPLEDVPRSIDEVIQNQQYHLGFQAHPGAPTSQGRPGGMRHGQGPGRELEKKDIEEFFHRVDRGLQPYLHHNERLPLLLAAVDYEMAIYRGVNTYPELFEEGLRGNPDQKSRSQLHQEGWERIRQRADKNRQAAAAAVEEAIEKGKGTRRLAEAVPAAYGGRVATCFVPIDRTQWGIFDEETGRVSFVREEKPKVKDLCDLVGVHTWLHKGTVFPIEADKIPAGGPVAVQYRY